VLIRLVVAYCDATLDGKLFALGGSQPANGHLSAVEAYYPHTNTWSKMPDLLNARFGLTAHIIADRMYAVGGIVKAPPNSGVSQVPTDSVEM
jgi:hypothetical protein